MKIPRHAIGRLLFLCPPVHPSSNTPPDIIVNRTNNDSEDDSESRSHSHSHNDQQLRPHHLPSLCIV